MPVVTGVGSRDEAAERTKHGETDQNGDGRKVWTLCTLGAYYN